MSRRDCINSVFSIMENKIDEIEDTMEFWSKFENEFEKVIKLIKRFQIKPCCIKLDKLKETEVPKLASIEYEPGKRKRALEEENSKGAKRIRLESKGNLN